MGMFRMIWAADAAAAPMRQKEEADTSAEEDDESE
jgi:hypothetical protein